MKFKASKKQYFTVEEYKVDNVSPIKEQKKSVEPTEKHINSLRSKYKNKAK